MSLLSYQPDDDPEHVRDLENAAEAEGRTGLSPADLAHEDAGWVLEPGSALLAIAERMGCQT